MSFSNGYNTLLVLIQHGSKPTKRLTDTKEISNATTPEINETLEKKSYRNKTNIRHTKMSRPDKYRKIKFKNASAVIWKEGEVIDASEKFGSDPMTCKVLLPNDDVEIVDFSKENCIWKYINFICDICFAEYSTKRGMRQQRQLLHEKADGVATEDTEVFFAEENPHFEKYVKLNIKPDVMTTDSLEMNKKHTDRN